MAEGNTLVQDMLDVVLRHLIAELRENGGGATGGASGYSLVLKGDGGTLGLLAEQRSVKIVRLLVADCYETCGTDIVAFVNGVLAGTDTSNSELAP